MFSYQSFISMIKKEVSLGFCTRLTIGGDLSVSFAFNENLEEGTVIEMNIAYHPGFLSVVH